MKLHTLPGVSIHRMRKAGEPPSAVLPGQLTTMYLEIGPWRTVAPCTYPIALVIVSPGSKIGHTPRKNPSIAIANTATSRINAYRGLRRLLANYLHKPFAAEKDYSIRFPALQVFFGIFIKFFQKNFMLCRMPHLPGIYPAQCIVFAGSQAVFYGNCNQNGNVILTEKLTPRHTDRRGSHFRIGSYSLTFSSAVPPAPHAG